MRKFDLAVMALILVLVAWFVIKPGASVSHQNTPHFAPVIRFPDAGVGPDGVVECPKPGTLTLHVVLDLDNQLRRDYLFVPFVEVSRYDGKNWETVWAQEYPSKAWTCQGRTHTKPEFREELLMPQGTYSVRYGLIDSRWDVDDLGQPCLVERMPGGASHSAWHVVK